MFKRQIAVLPAVGLVLMASLCCSTVFGQAADPIAFKVTAAKQKLELIVNTSRIITVDHKVPKLLVQNTDVLSATPLSPNKIQVSARRPGVTQLNLWNEAGDIYTVDVHVVQDARELEEMLKVAFPSASLKVKGLASSVMVSGYVPSAAMVGRVIKVSEDYYPNVINNIEVGGVQQVLLHTKIMEVSRSKMRALGFDWTYLNGNDFVIQTVSGLLSNALPGAPPTANGTGQDTVRFGVVGDNSAFFGFVEFLQEKNLAKVLAEPTLATVSGRPASFQSGGEFPILVPQSLGTVSIEYREFGTRVDYVPVVLGNGRIRLEVRPSVSEIDPGRSVTINSVTVPALTTRWVDTGVEMQAGQTLALAGLIQERTEDVHRGLPYLSDLPFVGSAFRRVAEDHNEIELLIMVRPEFIEPMDPHEVPPCGPGDTSGRPTDEELFFRGYIQVPSCDNCDPTNGTQAPVYGPSLPPSEELTPAVEMQQPSQPAVPVRNVIPVPKTTTRPRANSLVTNGQMPMQQSNRAQLVSSPETRPAARAAKPHLAPIVTPAQLGLNKQLIKSKSPTSPAARPVVNANAKQPGALDPPEPSIIGPIGYDNLDF